MSDYGIEISPGSKVVIFQGSVKKAPQLNKRGRKVSDLYIYVYIIYMYIYNYIIYIYIYIYM